jgi:cytochrome c553
MIIFGPQRGLTSEQCWLAARILSRVGPRQLIRGRAAALRYCLRIAAIILEVRGKRVGNTKWSQKMLGKLGELGMKYHALHITQADQEMTQKRRQAQKHWAQQKAQPELARFARIVTACSTCYGREIKKPENPIASRCR